MCVYVCCYKGQWGTNAIWEKKKFVFSKYAESQLHVFGFIVVCRDLETKEVTPVPPNCLEV